MGKKKNSRERNDLSESEQGVASVKNQLNESYQSGVIEDQLTNNKDIYTFNNQKR